MAARPGIARNSLGIVPEMSKYKPVRTRGLITFWNSNHKVTLSNGLEEQNVTWNVRVHVVTHDLVSLRVCTLPLPPGALAVGVCMLLADRLLDAMAWWLVRNYKVVVARITAAQRTSWLARSVR